MTILCALLVLLVAILVTTITSLYDITIQLAVHSTSNAQHPSIKLPTEDQVDNKLAMLDVLVSMAPEGNLSFSVYRKPTHTDHYLKFALHQPLDIEPTSLSAMIRIRSRKTITLKKYSLQLDIPSGHGIIKPAASSKAVPTRGIRPVKGHVTLPYVQGVMESLARILRTADIMVHMRPHKKIHALLVAPKDRTDKMEQAGVIYAVKCGGRDSGYVCETGCPLKKRIMEHHRDSSPVSQHANDSGHPVNYDQVKVLVREPGWFRRGVKRSHSHPYKTK